MPAPASTGEGAIGTTSTTAATTATNATASVMSPHKTPSESRSPTRTREHELPAHASPELPPCVTPRPETVPHIRALPSHLQPQPAPTSSESSDGPSSTPNHLSLPPSHLSPAYTPPSTPGSSTPGSHPDAKGVPVDSSDAIHGGLGLRMPKLLETLPEVNCVVRARIPTTTGTEMFLHLYQNNIENKEHLAIVFGPHIRSRSLDAAQPGETEMDRMIRGAYTGRLYPGRTTSGQSTSPYPSASSPPPADEPPLVRIHSECYTGETAWSARCDCGEQLDEAARQMSLPSSHGGVIIYLRQEGRGIGLGEKLKAYNLQDLGSDTVEANLLLRHPADARSYGLATAMLLDLGLGGPRGVRLLTNNPDKIRAVEGPNREVVVRQRVAMVPLAWRAGNAGGVGVHGPEVGGYLRTKVGANPFTLPRRELGERGRGANENDGVMQIEKMGHLLRMNEDTG
ncbi:MAG: GTP cyclohydrolase II [Thelocarpon superellum]|nr:MAG: GTP cyclohydrolase II [Thelocarpon superellum]